MIADDKLHCQKDFSILNHQIKTAVRVARKELHRKRVKSLIKCTSDSAISQIL